MTDQNNRYLVLARWTHLSHRVVTPTEARVRPAVGPGPTEVLIYQSEPPRWIRRPGPARCCAAGIVYYGDPAALPAHVVSACSQLPAAFDDSWGRCATAAEVVTRLRQGGECVLAQRSHLDYSTEIEVVEEWGLTWHTEADRPRSVRDLTQLRATDLAPYLRSWCGLDAAPPEAAAEAVPLNCLPMVKIVASGAGDDQAGAAGQ